MKTFIIAEAGVNHNGKINLAKKLIDQAAKIGANAIKFQSFNSSLLVTPKTKKSEYQKKNTSNNSTQLEMLKKLELTNSQMLQLKNYSKKKKIDFLVSCFDKKSFDFVINKIRPNLLKIASGELTNTPLLLDHAFSKKKIILSTGMCSISEIKQALGVIAFGYLNKKKKPGSKEFQNSLNSPRGKKLIKKKVTILHCTSDYPCNFKYCNLLVIKTLKEKFGTQVGFSDHTRGIEAAISAVSLGARIIEKHLTLNKKMPGPDHKASLTPNEFKLMSKSIRNIEAAMGDGKKMLMPSEKKNILVSRKSLCAAEDIKKNEIFTVKNLTAKRPGIGICPSKFWSLLGRKSNKNYFKNELIKGYN